MTIALFILTTLSLSASAQAQDFGGRTTATGTDKNSGLVSIPLTAYKGRTRIGISNLYVSEDNTVVTPEKTDTGRVALIGLLPDTGIPLECGRTLIVEVKRPRYMTVTFKNRTSKKKADSTYHLNDGLRSFEIDEWADEVDLTVLDHAIDEISVTMRSKICTK